MTSSHDNDLAAFLRARLDEDEARERQRRCVTLPSSDIITLSADEPGIVHIDDQPSDAWAYYNRISQPDPRKHVLADIDAKRRIVDAYLPPGTNPHPGCPCINYEGQDPAEYTEYDSCHRHLEASEKHLHHDYVLRLIALLYADHPDYREDWRP